MYRRSYRIFHVQTHPPHFNLVMVSGGNLDSPLPMSFQSLRRANPIQLVPAEIWQSILRHAIFVPLFFDIDPITSYGLTSLRGYHDTSKYWESERTRNKLRRVCSSWDVYLQRFAHRFINLTDIHHKNVPITALPLAYRVQMFLCKCIACVVNRRENEDRVRTGVETPELERLSTRHWTIEIVEIDSYWLRQNPLLTLLVAKSRVRVYIRPLLAGICTTIEESPSSELFLYFGMLGLNIRSPEHLTTLRLALFTSPVPSIPPMPNLKHLSILVDRAGESRRDILVDWLRSIGSQLVTFFWTTSERVEYTIPTSIWALCPSITSLQLPSDTLWKSPPPTHPITYLRLNLGLDPNRTRSTCIYCSLIHQVHTRYAGANIDDIVRCGNIKTVSFDRSWSTMLFYFDEGADVMCRYRWLKSHGVRYVDADGLTFEEYIISELKIGKRIQKPITRLFLF